MRFATLFALLFFFGVLPRTHAGDPVQQDAIRMAVDRSLPLMAKSAQEYLGQRECFSCHHQAMTVFALATAKSKGWTDYDDEISQQLERTIQFLKGNEARYREGQGQGGQADTAGYALWTLAIGEHPKDELTKSVVHYLLLRHEDRGHWQRTSDRPPTEASDFTTTFLALQGLKKFATDDQQEAAQKRIDAAHEWLKKTAATDTEDHVFRLRALALLEDQEASKEAAAALIALQRPDGGWSQLATMDSDAYATGSALVALIDTESITVDDLRYQAALKYLLDTQQADGSWHVVTRSKPIQTYFESGFPHGADQFISMSATGWATIALLKAM